MVHIVSAIAIAATAATAQAKTLTVISGFGVGANPVRVCLARAEHNSVYWN